MRARAIYAAFDAFPRAKGSSTHIASMVSTLARSIGPVTVLCLGAGGLPPVQSEGDIEIRRLPGRHPHLLDRATAFAGFVAAEAARHAATVELTVFRDPWGGAPLLDTLPEAGSLFEVNALPSWELAYTWPGFAQSPALAAKIGDLERRCLGAAHEILCVSSVTARALRPLTAAPITVLPNAAAAPLFAPPAGPCPLPELATGRWFGYIGGLQPWQGVEFLLDAFALIAADLPDLNLLILHSGNRGTRELDRRLTRLGLAGRVLLAGPVPHDDLPAVLARLEFTTAPLTETLRNTLQGCCPVKMIESMAAGVPVLASDLAVCREWMTHNVEGLLAPAGDRRAWAAAIHSLTPEKILRLGAAARDRARRDFAHSVVEERLGRLFQSAAAPVLRVP